MSRCPYTLQRDSGGVLWHASEPSASRALLNMPELHVRPTDQAVPAALQGSLLGRQFAYWLRQRDDIARAKSKKALIRALSALPESGVRTHAERQASIAIEGGWDHWTWASPIATTANLLGMSLTCLAEQQSLREKMQALALGLSGKKLTAADSACAELLMMLERSDGPLQAALRKHAPIDDWNSSEAFAANRLALLWQSYEAGAALLGNALIHLAEHPSREKTDIRQCLYERIDAGAAVYNTRRFAAQAIRIGNVDIKKGDCVLLDLHKGLGFGSGDHQCPGESIAITTVSAALEWLLSTRAENWPSATQILHLPNASIPLFSDEARKS